MQGHRQGIEALGKKIKNKKPLFIIETAIFASVSFDICYYYWIIMIHIQNFDFVQKISLGCHSLK